MTKRILAIWIAICMLLILPVGVQAADESKIVGQQLFLGDDLTMHFYASLSQQHSADGIMTITVGGEQYATYAVSSVTAGEDGNYDFAVSLGAAQMTQDIILTLTVSGQIVLQNTYSIQGYAQYLIDGNYNDETKALVREMLNYGAKAQLYFDVATDDLANAGNEIQTQAQVPESAPEVAVSGKVGGIRYYGSSVVFQSHLGVRYYFEVDGDVSAYEFTVNGTKHNPISKDNLYYIEAAGIVPQAIETEMNVAVTNGTDSMSLVYSPMHYIVRMYHKSTTDTELKDMLVAANGYFQAAKVFTGVKAPQPVFYVSDVTAAAGDQITVTVNIEHNPGLLGTMLTLTYDEDVLTLNSAKNGIALSGLSYMKPSRLKSGCNFVWFGSNPCSERDAAVLTLTFTVAESAVVGSYSIGIKCSESDTFDADNRPLKVETRNGTVTVS